MFVNYARLEDFHKLKELGFSVAGHIVIARYGKNFAGEKVWHTLYCNIVINFAYYLDPDWLRTLSQSLVARPLTTIYACSFRPKTFIFFRHCLLASPNSRDTINER